MACHWGRFAPTGRGWPLLTKKGRLTLESTKEFRPAHGGPFSWKEGTPVICIWPDNPELEDQRRCLELSEFEEEYDVVAKALEVRQKL